MVGFANPDQHVRPLGYMNCVPEGFDSSMDFAIVLGGDGFCGWPCAVNLAEQNHDVIIVDNLSRR